MKMVKKTDERVWTGKWLTQSFLDSVCNLKLALPVPDSARRSFAR